MDKKNYIKPVIKLVNLRHQVCLLAGSGASEPDGEARSLKWSETFDYE